MLALPGAVTATEIQAALELGLTTVKFFPAGTSGGAAAIAALAAPFVGVSFVPTGGVGPKNLEDYLSLPCVAAVGGSWMVPRDRVRAGVQRRRLADAALNDLRRGRSSRRSCPRASPARARGR